MRRLLPIVAAALGLVGPANAVQLSEQEAITIAKAQCTQVIASRQEFTAPIEWTITHFASGEWFAQGNPKGIGYMAATYFSAERGCKLSVLPPLPSTKYSN